MESESESIVEKEMWNREGKNQAPLQAGCPRHHRESKIESEIESKIWKVKVNQL